MTRHVSPSATVPGQYYPGTTWPQIQKIIEDTINHGSSSPNTHNRQGSIYTKWFPLPIGTTGIPYNFQGQGYILRLPAFVNNVVVINGEVITSFLQ